MTDLDKLLRFDPLDAAERITGESTADFDSSAASLGLGLALLHGDTKRKALEAAGDTMLSNDLDRYQRLIEAFGFEKVHEEPFTSQWGNSEKLFIYDDRLGFLLYFDTYASTQVNGGKVHYQWMPREGVDRWSCTSSGGPYRALVGAEVMDVWVGDHDCREALIFNLTRLLENGEIFPQWPCRSRVWVAHHQDWHDLEKADYQETVAAIESRTADRLAKCPEWVRTMVNGEAN